MEENATIRSILDSKKELKILDFYKKTPLKKEIFVDFNVLEWYMFKEMCADFCKLLFNNSYSFGTRKSPNGKNTYFYFSISDIKDLSIIIDYNDEIINNIIKKLTLTYISINIRSYDRVIIEVYQAETHNKKLDKILNNNIEIFFDRVVNIVSEIIKNIKKAEYVDGGLLTSEGLKDCNMEGYYESKYLEIDAGRALSKYEHGKIIKMHYKFKNAYVFDFLKNNKKYIQFHSILHSLIRDVFILFLRNDFCSIANLKYYPFDGEVKEKIEYILDKNNKGKICEYCFDFTQQKLLPYEKENFEFPQKAFEDAIDKVLLLDNKALNSFVYSCQSYREGLNSSVSYFHNYVALECIVKHEIKKGNEIDVKGLVRKYTNVNFDVIFEWCYKMRNKYAHNGITDKGIFNSFFREDNPLLGYNDCSYVEIEKIIEQITSYTLISWLLDS